VPQSQNSVINQTTGNSMIKKAVVLSVLLLSGCDTTYQSMGWDGGYQEQILAMDHYRLSYQGNATTQDSWVLQSWHRRASELCPAGYSVLSIHAPNTQSSEQAKEVFSNPLTRRNPEAVGEIKCNKQSLKN